MAAAELLRTDFSKYSLVLIDEVETSLHPRAQRRLIKDLANIARAKELQILLTTHSPFVLEELPQEARCYILLGTSGRVLATGVSPHFAMTQMDDEQHPEADVYVEDSAAATWVKEAIFRGRDQLLKRIKVIPFGAASVGAALGIMVQEARFPRPSCVFLDGDQSPSSGCNVLPGGDPPERVVFGALAKKNWADVPQKISRGASEVIDACNSAMAIDNHHEWVRYAADRLLVGGELLWSAMSSAWAQSCATPDVLQQIIQPIEDALARI